DFITLAYADTGAGIWTNRFHLSGADNRAVAVAADTAGNAVVSGYSALSPGAPNDFATIKYSSPGLALWTNRYDGSANSEDRAVALAVDMAGNVFVTGYSSNQTSGSDFVTIKYSGSGGALWTNRLDGPGHSEDR